ncbi:MAG: glycosyltransferase family 4 protein [Saprospiraceae bacterium]
MPTDTKDGSLPAPPATPIGYLVSQYPAVNHTFILREIRALRRLGWDIHVVSIRPPDRPPEKLSPEEVEEQRLTFAILGTGPMAAAGEQLRMFGAGPLSYLRTLWGAWQLAPGGWRAKWAHTMYFLEAVVAAAHFRRHGVTHFHTHFASTVALLTSRLSGIPFSVMIHGPDEFNDVIGFHMAEKVAESSFVATISRYASSQVMKASDPDYWNKIHALPLGVDPAHFTPRVLENTSQDRTIELVFVGRLAPAKAQHLLLDAVAKMVGAGRRNVHLTLVGEGPSRPSLESQIRRDNLSSYVTLAGACNQERVLEFYRRADIFTLASFAEGVPVVLMEAMSMEIPCVSTWITGIPELIRAGQDGLLVPPADVDALAGAIERLMDDPELCRQLGKSGREKVRRDYDLGPNTARLAAVMSRYVRTMTEATVRR